MVFALGFLAILLIASGIALFKMIMSPHLKYHSFWYKIKARIVFTFGHFRKLAFFPFFTTYGYDVHRLTLRNVREGAAAARPGDVGLHRDDGFLSNCAIPGAFKHAWIVVFNNDCVEAISDGVVQRDLMTPLCSDYVILLRPIGVIKPEVEEAVSRAYNLVGCEYDANFDFDIDEEDVAYSEYTKNLKSGFHKAFSCTETVAFCWYHSKEKLGLFRSRHAGRDAVIADDFLRMNYGIVWMSPSVSPEWAAQAGMPASGVEKIRDYLEGRRDFNEHGNPIPRRR